MLSSVTESAIPEAIGLCLGGAKRRAEIQIFHSTARTGDGGLVQRASRAYDIRLERNTRIRQGLESSLTDKEAQRVAGAFMNGVDFADIQGIVRFGYKHMTEACYVLLRSRMQTRRPGLARQRADIVGKRAEAVPDDGAASSVHSRGTPGVRRVPRP